MAILASSNNQKKEGNESEETDRLRDSKNEQDVKKRKNIVGFFELFVFADKWDIVMMILGGICAVINGAAFPGNMIVFSGMVEVFVEQGHFQNLLDQVPEYLSARNMSSHDVFVHADQLLVYCDDLYNYTNGTVDCRNIDVVNNIADEMELYSLEILLVALAVFISASLQVILFLVVAQRIVVRLRQECFRNMLRQEVAWFDQNKTGELTVIMTEDVGLIYSSIGDQIPIALQNYSACITGLTISFSYGWELALVMLSIVPPLIISQGLLNKARRKLAIKIRDAYSNAGIVAEEALSAVRTVVAFGGQKKEAERYRDNLHSAKELGIRQGFLTGVGAGLMWCTLFLSYAIGFCYGSKLVREGDYDIKQMMTVFYTTFLGAIGLGRALPTSEAITTGRAAAFKVYRIINKKPIIDSASPKGLKPESTTGTIEWKKVSFAYPSREDIKILHDFNLNVYEGQTVAFVGTSGCGKSTVIQLLLRFYDPDSGKICIDGHDIKDLNIKWLRQHIGLVSQEPTLFATSIAENIRYGFEGVTMDEIVKACKQANAYDFIMNLPQRFDTHVGEGGAQLSGGQKQRIAIARALVKNPKILLLDEATSALDSESEACVQDALDKATKGRTTVIIAHRLSTIRHADLIVAFSNGQVAEKGTHEELLANGKIYPQLVAAQTVSGATAHDIVENPIVLSNEENNKLNKALQNNTIKDTIIASNEISNNSENAEITSAPIISTMARLFKLNSPEWYYIILGAMASFCSGAVDPAWGILFGEVTKALAEDDPDKQESKMGTLSFLAVGVGLLSLVSRFLQESLFALSGESLTVRMRDLFFRAILRKNIGWFDDPRNSPAVLTTKLATEPPKIQMATGTIFGLMVQCFGTLSLGLAFAMYYCWQLALLLLCFVPLLVFCGIHQTGSLRGNTHHTGKAMEKAATVAMQSVANIRTVASLTKEEKFYQQYTQLLEEPCKRTNHFVVRTGLIYGISQAVYYMVIAVSFYFGGKLVESDDLTFYNMFRVFSCVALGAVMMGRCAGIAPETAAARVTAAKIFNFMDDIPPIDETCGQSLTPDECSMKSSIRMSNIHFHYPMRPGVTVLDGLNLSIKPGETLALVGESGCGKSTTVQLLERFYDPSDGTVYLDNNNIRDLNVQWLRSQIGLVSQEPVLFDRSIKDNIAYGDNSRAVSMNEIVQAAESANIHNFVTALPLGYETNVGSRGTQLSGGQKQRIAIARALVRNPQILLLDEATSALDTESEKIVQDALDKARQGRTCVMIAHRLSTIKDADQIAVFKEGVVRELGTHSQLMAKRGLYYKLQTSQLYQTS